MQSRNWFTLLFLVFDAYVNGSQTQIFFHFKSIIVFFLPFRFHHLLIYVRYFRFQSNLWFNIHWFSNHSQIDVRRSLITHSTRFKANRRNSDAYNRSKSETLKPAFSIIIPLFVDSESCVMFFSHSRANIFMQKKSKQSIIWRWIGSRQIHNCSIKGKYAICKTTIYFTFCGLFQFGLLFAHHLNASKTKRLRIINIRRTPIFVCTHHSTSTYKWTVDFFLRAVAVRFSVSHTHSLMVFQFADEVHISLKKQINCRSSRFVYWNRFKSYSYFYVFAVYARCKWVIAVIYHYIAEMIANQFSNCESRLCRAVVCQ